jgi:hypothetical protein
MAPRLEIENPIGGCLHGPTKDARSPPQTTNRPRIAARTMACAGRRAMRSAAAAGATRSETARSAPIVNTHIAVATARMIMKATERNRTGRP